MSSPIVLGGGIAGLSAAYYLSKLSNNIVTLVEGSSRVGGWIQSYRNTNGTLFEAGPRTMRLVGEQGLNTLDMLEDLKLSADVKPVLKTSAAAKNRMLYVNGKLHSLPNSFTSLFKTIPPFSKPLITALWNDLKTAPAALKDDSIHSFVGRRFGREIADFAVSALVCGVCAGDAKQISVNLLMGKLFEWEQMHGGVIKGMVKNAFDKGSTPKLNKNNLAVRAQKEGWGVWSLDGGLEKLPKTLSCELTRRKNVDIVLDTPCQRLELSSSEIKIHTENGKILHTNHLFCALPSKKLSKMLPDHRELQEDLAAIPTVTVAVVNLEFPGNVLPVDGFGFLVPPNQKLPILGVIFDSCCFPQENKTVLTVMMGGAWFSDYFGEKCKPEYFLETAVNQVKSSLSITIDPCDSRVSILKDCIPQYIIGHKERVENIKKYLLHKKLPITLLGSSYDGVGVNDVIWSARRAVGV